LDTLGKKLRQKRREQLITLKQLAEKTKLSVGFLSEIERGLAQPSISSLKKIAQTLGISLFNFREEQSNADQNGAQLSLRADGYRDRNTYISDVRVVRAGQRKKFFYPNSDAVYELLTPDLNRLLQVHYIQLEPGYESGPEMIVDPPGEKFVFVLQGSIEYRIKEEVVCLDEGDSLYYPGDLPVSFRVMGDASCRFIAMVTPPNF
jgi:transcriptional regulator with XRE-family HTH domain